MIRMKYIIAFLFVIYFPAYLFAADITLGLAGWYTFWDSSGLEEGMRGKGDDLKPSYADSFSMSPALMLGPSIGVSFLDRWHVSFIFLGSLAYKAESEYILVDLVTSNATPAQSDTTTRRYDFDLTLIYTINEYAGVFAGFKYLFGQADGTWVNRSNPFFVVDSDNEGHMYGPAMGVKITVPLTDEFDLSASISGIFLSNWTRQELTHRWDGYRDIEESQLFTYGYNTYVGINYFIEGISTVISAGFRYQDVFGSDDTREQIWGPMLSVVYAF